MIRRAHEFFETILQKPEPTRKIIAAIAVIFLVTIIVGIWWTTLSIKTTQTITENQNFAEASPFNIAWNSIKNAVRLNPIFNK